METCVDGWLRCDGYTLNQWLSKPSFVGFRYGDGSIGPTFTRPHVLGDGCSRAPHVVVEE